MGSSSLTPALVNELGNNFSMGLNELSGAAGIACFLNFDAIINIIVDFHINTIPVFVDLIKERIPTADWVDTL